MTDLENAMIDFKQISSSALWRGAALTQVDRFEQFVADLAGRHRLTAKVVGKHKSKSIDLPVIEISTDAGVFTLRDNFNDLNLMVVLKNPAMLTLDEFFVDVQDPRTWDWYLAEIDKARNYSWREWSDEDMADPRILRVRDKRPGVDLWWEKDPEEKDRWANRLSSPAWWSTDWSSGEVTWDGRFGPGVRLFIQKRAYAEGIAVVTGNKRYQKGCKDFIIATDTLRSAGTMIERLTQTANGP